MNSFFLNDTVYFFHIHYKCISFEDDFGYFCEPDDPLKEEEFTNLYLNKREKLKTRQRAILNQGHKTENTEHKQSLKSSSKQTKIDPNLEYYASTSDLNSLSCFYYLTIILGIGVGSILQLSYRQNHPD